MEVEEDEDGEQSMMMKEFGLQWADEMDESLNTYQLVDVLSFEIQVERRRRIEDFCLYFFKDFWSGKQESSLAQICRDVEKKNDDISRSITMYITKENMDASLQAICSELFRGNDYADIILTDAYIVSLLIFCIQLDKFLRSREWYSPVILLTSLVNALITFDFNPIHWNLSRDRGINTTPRQLYTSILTVVPALLCFYIMFK